MGLKRMVPFYGSKCQVSAYYGCPRHDAVIEPFAGGAGYALLHWRKKVQLYDVDPVIVGVWDYLIKATPEEIWSLPETVPETVNDLPICQEAKWLLGFWVNPGTASPRQRLTDWGKSTFGLMRPRLAAQVPLIKHWTVNLCDYREIPRTEATWFVDPPYQGAGKHYKHSSSGIDYEHLGDWCQSCPGQTIVCENVGAEWLPFRPFKKLDGGGGAGGLSRVSHEAIWESSPTQIELALC